MRILIIGLCFLSSLNGLAQFKIDKSSHPKRDIQSALSSGSGIEILSVEHNGKNASFGTFTNGKNLIGLEEGFIISSGFVEDIAQQNISPGTSGKTYNAGIPFLDELSGVETKDGTEIIVSFKAKSQYISFNFVFGSEEYPEYSTSQFNDTYAFTLEGENYPSETNIALIPNTSHYIGINSINHLVNEEYYISNSTIPNFKRKKEEKIDSTFIEIDGKEYAVVKNYNITYSKLNKATFPIEFDGFTKVMQVMAKVVPEETYQLRILIADGSDRKLDSGVFIEKGSFNSHPTRDFAYGILSEPGYYYTVDTVFIKDLPKKECPIIMEKAFIQDSTLTYLFEVDSWDLSENDQKDLTAKFIKLGQTDSLKFKVTGYTDETGSSTYNYQLGLKRAETIKSILLEKGINSENIKTISLGEIIPSSSINIDDVRAKNRKVIIQIMSK